MLMFAEKSHLFYITVTTSWITHDSGLNVYLWLPSVTVGSMVMFSSGVKKGRREPYHMLTSVSLWKPAHVIKYDGKGLSGWPKKKNMFVFACLKSKRGKMVFVAISDHCYGDPASSDVGLRYSPGWLASLFQVHRNLILWILPAASAAAPPILRTGLKRFGYIIHHFNAYITHYNSCYINLVTHVHTFSVAGSNQSLKTMTIMWITKRTENILAES